MVINKYRNVGNVGKCYRREFTRKSMDIFAKSTYKNKSALHQDGYCQLVFTDDDKVIGLQKKAIWHH